MAVTITETPWAPFVPAPDDPWDLRKVAHLHRRAGFGATWDELHDDLKHGPAAAVARLLDPPAVSSGERELLDSLREGALRSADVQRLKAYWLYRMRFGTDPLREKLTLFWHDHFATSITKVDSVHAMAQQVETLREHALGPFATLLGALIADPAMLVWLDGGTSKKASPNENFARELLELFTLGTGHYTEADIRAAARAFTGWTSAGGRRTADDAHPQFVFESDAHDDGPKTFLGQTGTWKAEDVVQIILERPDAARHLARKLYHAFVAEDAEPGPELIEPLAEALRTSGYSIRHVMEIILGSRHFYSESAYRRRVKSPIEFSLGLVRALEVPRTGLNLLALAAACDRQGQKLFAPPSVKGWDGGTSWLNSATMLERLNWATDAVWGNPEYGVAPYDAVAWARTHNVTLGDAAGAFVNLVLQGDLDPEAEALVQSAGHAGRLEGLRKALQRLLHCPEFQLA
jgi:uncharacterized protein (DUF1800 family)